MEIVIVIEIFNSVSKDPIISFTYVSLRMCVRCVCVCCTVTLAYL